MKQHFRAAMAATLVLSAIPSIIAAQDFQKGIEAAQVGDFETALENWRQLAAQGDADAQYSLGVMYDNGEGVPEDDAEAVRWFRLAAEQGHADAQNSLGFMLNSGEGVVQDFVSALMWWNIAGANGAKLGRENRDQLEKRMTAEDISEARRRARVCFASGYKDCGG